MTQIMLHANVDGHPACKVKGGDLAPSPEESTCGHENCAELRTAAKKRIKERHEIGARIYEKIYGGPLVPSRAYALEAYGNLDDLPCPGGSEHEGRGSRIYCKTCIRYALGDAFEVGRAYGKGET